MWWKRSSDDTKEVYYKYALETCDERKEYKELRFNKAKKDCFYNEKRTSYKSIRAMSITINNARGGEKSFYDRIDFTLFDLKQWYLKQPCKLEKAFDNSREWLLMFKDFNELIDYFLLQDFVNEEYEIKNLASFFEGEKYTILSSSDVYPASIPSDYIAYKTFVEGLLTAIKKKKYSNQGLFKPDIICLYVVSNQVNLV